MNIRSTSFAITALLTVPFASAATPDATIKVGVPMAQPSATASHDATQADSEAGSPAGNFSGLFVGLGGGYAHHRYATVHNQNLSYNAKGLEGHVLAGYAHVLKNRFLLGLDLGGSFGGVKQQENGARVSSGHSLAFHLRPGFVATPNLAIYALLGGRDITTKYQAANVNRSYSKVNPEFGLGFEYKLNQKFGIRTEVLHATATAHKNETSYPRKVTRTSARTVATYNFK